MSEGNAADGSNKSRSVLGDVTNRIGKRGFSEGDRNVVKSKHTVKHTRVSPHQSTEVDFFKDENSSAFSERSIVLKTDLTCVPRNSEEFNGKNAVNLSEKMAKSRNVDPMFSVDNCSVNTLGDMPSFVDDAVMMIEKIGSRNCDLEMFRVINSVDSKTGGCVPFGKMDLLKDKLMLEIPNSDTENTSPNVTASVKSNGNVVTRNSSEDHSDLGGGNALPCVNIKANNKLGDITSVNTCSTVSETGGDCFLDCINCVAGEAKVSLEGTQKNLVNYPNEVEGHHADNFIMSQSDSIDCAVLPDSLESIIFGVEKSFEPKEGKECFYKGGGVDAIKTCSCSFCIKAAYMWLDLHYQDIRGRVSVTRKSQKEASILAERYRMTKETEKHNAQGSSKISKLETDLMDQWKFLFQHMAGIWEQEGDHLETSLLPLTDLREKYRRDLGSN